MFIFILFSTVFKKIVNVKKYICKIIRTIKQLDENGKETILMYFNKNKK